MIFSLNFGNAQTNPPTLIENQVEDVNNSYISTPKIDVFIEGTSGNDKLRGGAGYDLFICDKDDQPIDFDSDDKKQGPCKTINKDNDNDDKKKKDNDNDDKKKKKKKDNDNHDKKKKKKK